MAPAGTHRYAIDFPCGFIDADLSLILGGSLGNGQAISKVLLRYVGELSDDLGTAGLRAVPMGSVLANLEHFRVRTGRYDHEPPPIAGKGAGVTMTAARC